MINLSGIKNIIFDLGGVILNVDYDKTSAAFKKLGFENFDDFYSQKEQTALFNELETGKINEETFISRIQQEQPNLNPSEIIAAWNAMLLDLPTERIKLIQSLAKKYNVFLLSNTNAIHLTAFSQNIIVEHGSDILTPCFKKVFLSHEIGFRKPDRACFEHVLNDQSLQASETLFLDDSIQHVEGAKQCGLHSHFVDVKNGQSISQLFPDTTQ